MSSSQLTNSYFSEGWPWPTNQDCHCWHKIQLFYSAAWLSRWAHRWSPLAHCQIVWNQPWFAGPPWFPRLVSCVQRQSPHGFHGWNLENPLPFFCRLFLSILFPMPWKKSMGLYDFFNEIQFYDFQILFPPKKKKKKHVFFPKTMKNRKIPWISKDWPVLSIPRFVFRRSWRLDLAVLSALAENSPAWLDWEVYGKLCWDIIPKIGKTIIQSFAYFFFFVCVNVAPWKEPQFWDGWMLFQQPFLGCGSQ